MKKIFIAGAFILFAVIVQAQNVGIGTTTPVARLQINHRSSTTVGLQLLDSTNLRSGTIRFSTINNPVGIIMEGIYESSFNKDHYLDISSDSTFIATFRGDGNVGIGTIRPTAKLDVNGSVKIQGINTVEFGAGLTKELNAGKIGYQTFTPGALDIVGAGTLVSNRKVNIFAEGGTTFNGQVGIGILSPASSAKLDVSSSTQGFLTPRMTAAQRTAIVSPAEGLLIYQTNAPVGFYFYKAGVWTRLFETSSYPNGTATPIVSICCQSWMTKNLDVATYRNGDPIPRVENNSLWASIFSGAYCYYNNDSTTYAAIYGKLYNWFAVNDPRGLAPEGWHIPTDFEWTTLENCLGGAAVAGGATKETGTTYWATPNLGATNISGWTGLPGGFRNPANGAFTSVGNYGYWWSSTEFNTGFAWIRYLFFNNSTLSRDGSPMQGGFYVRCIRD